MKNLMLLLCGGLLFGVMPAAAQMNPCGASFNFSVTKSEFTNNRINWQNIGRQMQTCDSLLVMSKPAFRKVVVEREFERARADSLRVLVGVLEQGQDLRGELIQQQDSFIQFQQQKLQEYDQLLVRSNQLVEDATRNTDRALKQIKLYKLLSAGGIVIGGAGILIGAALAL